MTTARARTVRLGTLVAALAVLAIDTARAETASPRMDLVQVKPGPRPSAETMEALGQVAEKVLARWRPDCATADRLSIRVRLLLDATGGLRAPPQLVEPQDGAAGDPVLRDEVGRALVAVEQAAPFEGLPVADYDSWKQFIVRFDGRTACGASGVKKDVP